MQHLKQLTFSSQLSAVFPSLSLQVCPGAQASPLLGNSLNRPDSYTREWAHRVYWVSYTTAGRVVCSRGTARTVCVVLWQSTVKAKVLQLSTATTRLGTDTIQVDGAFPDPPRMPGAHRLSGVIQDGR
uniref:Putative secreted protein n=1 Tax=Anopheles darlingi TaxID=43151 RepID=A0A2M4DDB8_ANODA